MGSEVSAPVGPQAELRGVHASPPGELTQTSRVAASSHSSSSTTPFCTLRSTISGLWGWVCTCDHTAARAQRILSFGTSVKRERHLLECRERDVAALWPLALLRLGHHPPLDPRVVIAQKDVDLYNIQRVG
jgi:hypothetical protein